MSVPGARAKIAPRIRKDSIIWDDGAYETMAQFYRPRADLFVDDLRQRMSGRETVLFDSPQRVAANLDDFGARIFEIHTWVDDKRLIPRIESLIEDYLKAPIHVEPEVSGSTTQVLLRSLKRLDELGCSRQGFADMSTLNLVQKNYPLSGE